MLILCEAGSLFQAQNLLLERLRQAGENVPTELRQKQEPLLSIEARLGNLPKQPIIYHYTQLHNALDPNHQLLKGAALYHIMGASLILQKIYLLCLHSR